MKDDYILLLLRRPSKKNILDDVLSNIDLTICEEKTLLNYEGGLQSMGK